VTPRSPRMTTTRGVFAGLMAVSVGLLAAGAAAPTAEDELQQYAAANAQSFVVPASVEPALVQRDEYGATPGYGTFIAGGTNHDWAKLVLLMGEFPLTDSNVTVVTRWMRQENYVDAWWTRNNPLNNGWGSGGGGGTGRYVHLVDAAENAAEALHALPRYREIVATLQASAPTEQVERAIWFSGWATGLYNNGAHWSYTEVPVVPAPPSVWGR